MKQPAGWWRGVNKFGPVRRIASACLHWELCAGRAKKVLNSGEKLNAARGCGGVQSRLRIDKPNGPRYTFRQAGRHGQGAGGNSEALFLWLSLDGT